MNETSPPTTAANAQLLEKRYRTSMLAVSVQILIMLALTVAAWFVITYSSNDISEQAGVALWGTILLIAAGSFILRRMLFSWDRLKSIALLRGIPGLLDSLQAYTILLGMFGLIVAIMGFLVATLSGNKFEMLRAGAISLIVFLINFPRRSVWQKILAGAESVLK
ncbi:MAG: hypothetical protein M3384_22530 [Acidobacteriota bacterium]|nr:hypothetical protein [Acidobacteriota bacterium]